MQRPCANASDLRSRCPELCKNAQPVHTAGMSRLNVALEWDAIRYFLCAAQAKSLSGAARSLGVEHSTVGRRISSLEAVVGSALVVRTPSGLELTRLGRRVLRRALAMEKLAGAIAALADTERTRVRVVAPTGFSALFTPSLAVLHREQPGIELEVVSSSKRMDLRRGRADLAIRVGPVEDLELVVRKVGEVHSALYAARSYLAKTQKQVDPDDLSGQAVIGFHSSLAQMPAAEWLAARSRNARIVVRGREAVDMLSIARSGAGLAVLPCFLADAERELVRLTPQPVAARRVSLVYRRDARLSPELRAVIAFFADLLRQHARALRGEAS